MASSQITEFTKSISNFASEFYNECADSKPGDVIISPLSVASALALLSQGSYAFRIRNRCFVVSVHQTLKPTLCGVTNFFFHYLSFKLTYLGANGNTFEELRKGLRLSNDKSVIANNFHDYYVMLDRSVGKSTFSIANQIYVMTGYKIHPQFQEIAVKKFSSGIEALNFADAAPSARHINKFVEEKTKDKIKNLIAPDMLSGDTRVVLVNAIYFKGNWEHQFNKDRTYEGDFFVSETEKTTVEFMTMKKKFNYVVLDKLDATALEMKYAHSNFSFVIVLPNQRSGLAALEKKLRDWDLTKLTNDMYPQEVDVTIPKFKVEFEINLNDVLKKVTAVRNDVAVKCVACFFFYFQFFFFFCRFADGNGRDVFTESQFKWSLGFIRTIVRV